MTLERKAELHENHASHGKIRSSQWSTEAAQSPTIMKHSFRGFSRKHTINRNNNYGHVWTWSTIFFVLLRQTQQSEDFPATSCKSMQRTVEAAICRVSSMRLVLQNAAQGVWNEFPSNVHDYNVFFCLFVIFYVCRHDEDLQSRRKTTFFPACISWAQPVTTTPTRWNPRLLLLFLVQFCGHGWIPGKGLVLEFARVSSLSI